ncbi:MAG: hypothetical protein KAT65_23330 [Methanophagales archaeon]|nr:hypothetical protein [Methanophagales archaeon]
MKGKMGRRSLVGIAIIFLVAASVMSMAVPAVADQSASASRDIQIQTLTLGESTLVSIAVTNSVTQSLILDEDIPVNWTLTPVDNASATFKSSENKWLWSSGAFPAGETKTVIYNLTVPSGAAEQDYHISGIIRNSSGIIDTVKGEDTITVTLDKTPPTIEFVEPPTPENNSINTTGNVTITVTVADSSGVSTVLLNWNGENESMNPLSPGTQMMYMTGDATWSINKTDLSPGDYAYKVYANDTYDNWGESETRVVTVEIVKNILDYYRTYEDGDVSTVTDIEILKAEDDWIGNVIPQGFDRWLSDEEILTLEDEWVAT